MAEPIYFPILRAKAGEIDAIGRLAPKTQSLTRPMLDFPRQKAKDTRPLARYLGEKIQEIKVSWGTSNEIYLDFSRYEPNTKLPDGQHIADYVFENNSWGANAVRECAAGYGDPGGPAQWVARDTNMHIEGTVSAMVRYATSDTAASSQTGTELSNPWLQGSLGLTS